jgi:hypothetical protein
MEFGVRLFEFLFGAVLERFGQDGGRIGVVNNHNVLVALAGRDWKTAGLVGVNLPGNIDHLRIHKMGSNGRLCYRGWRRHDYGGEFGRDGWANLVGGTEVFWCGFEVTFGRGKEFW